MLIVSRIVAGAFHWDAIDEQTWQVVESIIIPKTDFDKWPTSKRERVVSKSYSEKDDFFIQLNMVPESIINDLSKITLNVGKLFDDYRSYVEPMIKSIVTSVEIELEISTRCDKVWKALLEHDTKLAGEHLHFASAAITKLKKHKDAYRALAVDATAYIDMLKKRQVQYMARLSKIDKDKVPKVYADLMEDYNSVKSTLEVCIQYQAQIPSWEETEGRFLKAAQDAFHLIDQKIIQPGSKKGGASESKENNIQPPSPTVIKSGSDSKEDSPINSRNRNSSDEKNDSPGLKPMPSRVQMIAALSQQGIFSNDNKPLSQPSLPNPIYVAKSNMSSANSQHALLGSNSQAIQQQKQAALLQKQSASNLAAARLPNRQ